MGDAIHWFPGHMTKALREMKEKIKLADVVFELLDTRIPVSSLNEEFEKLVEHKRRVFIFTKADLADPVVTKEWTKKFEKQCKEYIFLDVLHDNVIQILSKKIEEIAEQKHRWEIIRGMKPQPVRVMIIGIPNVGKSTLINRLCKRKAAGVQNKPGFTRGEQFIKINNDFMLIDTPGVLPMSYENKTKAMNLALVGSMKEDILPLDEMASYLIAYLAINYPHALKERFNIEDLNNEEEVLNQIAQRRGLLGPNGTLLTDKAVRLLLKEFRDGKLAKISLERVK